MHGLRWHGIIHLLLFISTQSAFSQFARFKHLTTDEGLSDNTVYCITQDSKGFIWCGTENGINKFDGYKVTSYPYNPEDSTAMPAAQVRCMYADKHDRLWIGTAKGGLVMLDLKSNVLRNWLPDSTKKNSISSDVVNSILEYNDSTLMIATTKGLNFFSINSNTFQTYHHSDQDVNSLLGEVTRGLALDQRGHIYVGNPGKGMTEFIPSENRFIRYEPGNDKKHISAASVKNIFLDREGLLWISLWNSGFNVLDTKTGIIYFNRRDTVSFMKNLSAGGLIYNFYQDRKGHLWFASVEDGIQRYNKKTGELIMFKNNPDDAESFADNTSFSVFEDKAGLIWGGTWHGGMSRFNPNSLQFGHYKHEKNSASSIANNNVYTFEYIGKHEVAIGTSANISIFNMITKQIKPIYTTVEHASLQHNSQVTDIQLDSDSTLWIATGGGGLYHYFPKQKKYKNYVPTPQANTILTDNELKMALDHQGNLWVSCPLGLMLYNRKTDDFTRFLHNDADPNSIPVNELRCIASDSKGRIWLGTLRHGLILLNPERKEFTYFLNRINPKTKQDLDVLFIYPDSKGFLWLITTDGFFKLNPENKELINYSEKDPFIKKSITAVLEDKHQNMWVLTEKELNKFNEKNGELSSFYQKDGLQSKIFYFGSQLKTPEGFLFFGGVNGFNFFDPAAITEDKMSPDVILTDFQVLNKPFHMPLQLAWMDEVELSYRDYFFSVDFAASDFSDPAFNTFEYKLSGFNQDWVDIGNQHSITFTNLDPGTYTLMINTCNSSGHCSEKPMELKISISPPFWKTKWFYFMCIVSGILIIYGYIKWREKQLIIEKTKLETKVTERTEELRIEKVKVEEAHKDIKDSILYAKKIQSAILPTEEDFARLLPGSFILFRPKDIVSGDFYWISEQKEYVFYAVADCTGHGVPGGFMTMLGSGLLNEIVNEHQIHEPAEILNKLREKIIVSLKQTGKSGESKDGMDIVLIRVDKQKNEICYSAANNGFIIIREGKIMEFGGDKQPVGIYGDELRPFTQHTITVLKEDKIYAFTDGYPDQFGGPKGKKFKYKPLNELLLSGSHLQEFYQKERLEKTFTDWKGQLEQIDDVCIIGVKV